MSWKRSYKDTHLCKNAICNTTNILTFHDLNQTSSILDEENVMQRKRSTHEKLLNIFT